MSAIPVVLVRVIASGHVCVINESDFDAATHERVSADAPTAEPAQPPKAKGGASKAKGGA